MSSPTTRSEDPKLLFNKIEQIEEKITKLNHRVLSPRTTSKLSETLKGSLKGFFKQINKLLKEIESIEEDNLNSKRRDLERKKTSLESHLRATGILDLLEAELKTGLNDNEGSFMEGNNESGKLSGKKRKDRSNSNFPLSDLFTESEGKFLGGPQMKKKSIEKREKIPSKNVKSIFDLKKNFKKNLMENLESKLQDSSTTDENSTEEEDDLLNDLLAPKKTEEENLLDELNVIDEENSHESSSSHNEKPSRNGKPAVDSLLSELDVHSSESSESDTDEQEKKDILQTDIKRIIQDTLQKNDPKSTSILTPLVDRILQKKDSIMDTKDKEKRDNNGLVRGYGISEDINIPGMRRSKELLRMFQMNKRQKYEMQDTHFCSCDLYKDVALFCVFDGHLGSSCSKELVTLFPFNLIRYLRDIIQSYDDIPHMWGSLYRLVDSKLKDYVYEGSTATTVLVWKNDNKIYLICANVGDSTGYLIRNGKPIPISLDHKLSYDYERDRIKAMGVDIEEQQTRIIGLNVSRAFGDHFPKEKQSGVIVDPYVSPVYEICNEDSHVIIASDGLWDVMTAEEAYETMIQGGCNDSQVMAHRLLKKATSNTKCQDNVTVIVVSLN